MLHSNFQDSSEEVAANLSQPEHARAETAVCVDLPSFACAVLPRNAPFCLCFNTPGQGKVNLGGKKNYSAKPVPSAFAFILHLGSVFNIKQCLLVNANDRTQTPITSLPPTDTSFSFTVVWARKQGKKQSQPNHNLLLSDRG